MLPVVLNVELAGSYIWAVLRELTPSNPPAISTVPLLSKVAVWFKNGLARPLRGVKVPVGTSYNSGLAK
jgi:hypothetical protein